MNLEFDLLVSQKTARIVGEVLKISSIQDSSFMTLMVRMAKIGLYYDIYVDGQVKVLLMEIVQQQCVIRKQGVYISEEMLKDIEKEIRFSFKLDDSLEPTVRLQEFPIY